MESLVDTADFVRMVEKRQGIKIGAEIAFKYGWIDRETLLASAERYGKIPYGQHLKNVADGKPALLRREALVARSLLLDAGASWAPRSSKSCGKDAARSVLSEKLLNATVLPVDLPELDISTTGWWMSSSAATAGCHHQLRRLHQRGRLRGEPRRCLQGKCAGPRNLAQAKGATGARLVHVSTDYVFSGRERRHPRRMGGHHPGPISAYGSTKLMGEKYVEQFCHRHFIVRTAWLLQLLRQELCQDHRQCRSEIQQSWRWSTTSAGNPTNAVDLAHGPCCCA